MSFHVVMILYLACAVLSANGDTKLVMKGITHGACDYLVKPVRMEELKNIWQHVVRRKKFDSRDRNSSSTLDKNSSERNGMENGSTDPECKLSKKRKDQYSEDDDEQDENDHDNDDPATQKKPRVVWSVELHRKFVAAVNQLGLEKAVPKKILELMNVKNLTRENVASHLQKYRLYLKRLSSDMNRQANMAAALGGLDSPYMRMNYHNLSGSPHFQNSALRCLPPAGVLGRLNTPAGLGLHGMAHQLGHHGQLSRTGLPDCTTNFQRGLLPGDQTANVLQGMPTSLDFDQLQPRKATVGVDQLCPTTDNSRIFSVPGSNLSDSANTIATGPSTSFVNLPNSSITVLGNVQDRKRHQVFGLNSDTPPNLLDHNSTWPAAVESQSTPNPMESIVHDFAPNIPKFDPRCQAGLMNNNNAVQDMSYAPKQVWDNHKLDLVNRVDHLDGSVSVSSTMAPQGVFPCAPVADPKSTSVGLHRNTGLGSMGKPRFDSLATQHTQVLENSGVDLAGTPFSSYAAGDAGFLEDVVTSMFKREQGEATSNGGDMGCDLYSLRTCI